MSFSLIRPLLQGDERIAVTGASGWLGRTALDLLAELLGPVAFGATVAGFATRAKSVVVRSGLSVPLRPLSELATTAPPPTHLLHFAYLTRDRLTAMGTERYALANLGITATVTDAVERFRLRGVMMASSGAVYEDGHFASDVDANPYGALKRLEELSVRRAAADVGARSVVARVFSVAGPYMTKPDLYALGDLVLRAIAGSPLLVRARRPVYRSYCAAADVVALSLGCLLGEGDADAVFDTGGEVVEIGELADHVRGALELPHLPIEREMDPALPADRYVGNPERFTEMAARLGLTLQPLDVQIRSTAGWLRREQLTSAPM